MTPEGVVGRSIALAWIFSAVTAGVVLSSCATSGDLRELGYTVDKRLSLAEAEIAELHTDAADRAEVERRFAEAREEFEDDVEKVAQSTEARAESMAGTLSRAVGLPEAIGILGLIAVFVYRFLPRLVERAMDEHRRSVSEFAGQLRAEREYFERQMQLERDACRDQFEMVLSRHDEQQRQTVAALQRIENEIHQR